MKDFDSDENVLVFPSTLLSMVGYFEGLNYNFTNYLEVIGRNSFFMSRNRAETSSEYKQVIPYGILFHGQRVFKYRRGMSLAEGRLRGLYSIGVGGHISGDSHDGFHKMYKKSLEREIREELVIEASYDSSISAVLNDDSNEVGKVHFGIVCMLRLSEEHVRGKEDSILDAGFVDIRQLFRNLQSFENWSRICIGEIRNLLRLCA